MKPEYLVTSTPAALSQGACRGSGVDPEWWVGEHGGWHHKDCHHQEARHICITHCPVKDLCLQWGSENPDAWVGMVMGGELRVTIRSTTRATKLTDSPPMLHCLLCEPLDE